jgi:hypothetical protein
MQGDKMAAVTACENVVAHFYAGGTLPPGFTVEQKENWYTGCEDAVETAAQDDSRATRPPSAEVSESS